MKNIFQLVPETEALFLYLFKNKDFEYKTDFETLNHPFILVGKECMLATYRKKLCPQRFVELALKAGFIMYKYQFFKDIKKKDFLKGDYLTFMEELNDMSNKGTPESETYFGGSGRGVGNE